MGPEILFWVWIHHSSGLLTVAILRSSSMDRGLMIQPGYFCESDSQSESS
jgi:hypothetical protein